MAVKKNENRAFICFQEFAKINYVLTSIDDHYHKNRLKVENKCK
ncbi:3959_t:CDS:2 [Dentiscutata heterogama]|uniref:3959_t:CDS:1 n=1 Tax=Dentiscutata heterogama TaxID=1316150 RepID=A0ACA9KN39_9GLOM|nr:3959_t:CDS:2 [Dentiscutata heterogama]